MPVGAKPRQIRTGLPFTRRVSEAKVIVAPQQCVSLAL
jgi:hypothetical protein